MTIDAPILLVPGLGGSPRIFAPQIPVLWRYRAVMIANHMRDATMAAIASRILDEAPPRFALAGHSMGGYIALEIMRQAPQRVERLALLNTQARPDTPEVLERRRATIEFVKANGLQSDATFPNFVHSSRVNDEALRQKVREMTADVSPESYLRAVAAVMGRPDSRPVLGTIRCPTLVLGSDEDKAVPGFLSEEMALAIPGARLVIVPECGHLSQIERPEAVTAALLDWLAM